MEWGAIATGTGTLVVAVGLGITWLRNGREQKARDLAMAAEQAQRDADAQVKQQLRDQTIEGGYLAIVGRLDDEHHGLAAIETKVDAVKLETTDVLGRHDERLKTLEDDGGG